MDLVDVCFDIVEAIPYPYKLTFSNQLIAAGISIPSNIAEGSRRPTKAYLNHLSFSLGSHGEVETLFEVIRRRKLVPEALLSKGIVLIDPIGKMLHGLVGSLDARANARHS
jgi:four helix bundle protein